jgi:hypothetical protein
VLTIERLVELKGVIKWNAVFGEAGLNPNTMRSAVHHQRELRADEAKALVEVLRRHGLMLYNPSKITDVRSEPAHAAQVQERGPDYSGTSND